MIHRLAQRKYLLVMSHTQEEGSGMLLDSLEKCLANGGTPEHPAEWHCV